MLPRQILLAVLTALVSQGNLVAALPQGEPHYNARIEGRSTGELATRELRVVRANPPAPDSVQRRGDLDVRTLGGDIAAYSSLGLAGSGAVYGTGRYFFKETDAWKAFEDAGVKITKATSAQIANIATKVRNALTPAERQANSQADIESQLGSHGLSVVPASVPLPDSASGSAASEDTFQSAQG